MISKGEVVLVSKIEKGSTWLLSYWQTLHNLRLLFNKELHKFKTCLRALVEGWSSLWCHLLVLKENVKTEKITTIQWSKGHKNIRDIQEISQNEKAYKVLPFGEDNHLFQLKPLNKQSSMFGLKGT